MSVRPHPVVSIAFQGRDQVDQTIAYLMEHGVARDEIEVVTDPTTAAREFRGLQPKVPYELLADVGRGALIGLVASVCLSLVLVAVSPLQASPVLAIVQLLGPNVGTLGGALIGAMVGFWRPRPPSDLYCRVRQTGGILMLVHCRTGEEAETLRVKLGERGGRDGIVVTAR